MKNNNFFKSLSCALRGIGTVFLHERNFRFDCFAALLVFICAFLFSLDKWEKCVVFSLCALVLSLEALNSAIERTVDLAEPSFNPAAGSAKDISAAAVLISAVFSALIGLYIFIPRIAEFLGRFYNG